MASLSGIFAAAGRPPGTFRRPPIVIIFLKKKRSFRLPSGSRQKIKRDSCFFEKHHSKAYVVDRVGELELFHNCSCGTMDERLPQTIAEAFACKFPELNAEKFTRRSESFKSVDIEDVDDLKIFTDAGLEKLDVSETVRSALRAVKADLVPPASSPSKHSAVSFDEDVSAPAIKKPRLIDSQQCHQS